ncbi:MAG: MarC family protein [Neptuniibacter sp.]|nr:MarC family protein [Neptuniibacter sp.]
MNELISTYIFFFAVIDPIGTVPVFIAATKGFNEREKRLIALKATLIATCVLIFFVIAGELILTALNIPLAAFQVSGGIVLFLFALTMIFGEGKPESEINLTDKHTETAIFPLAIPSIASPGAMLGAVMLTDKNYFNVYEQLETAFVMMIVLLNVLFFLLISTWINKKIGRSGASIISRIMGFILASVAITSVLSGIQDFYGL